MGIGVSRQWEPSGGGSDLRGREMSLQLWETTGSRVWLEFGGQRVTMWPHETHTDTRL